MISIITYISAILLLVTHGPMVISIDVTDSQDSSDGDWYNQMTVQELADLHSDEQDVDGVAEAQKFKLIVTRKVPCDRFTIKVKPNKHDHLDVLGDYVKLKKATIRGQPVYYNKQKRKIIIDLGRVWSIAKEENAVPIMEYTTRVKPVYNAVKCKRKRTPCDCEWGTRYSLIVNKDS